MIVNFRTRKINQDAHKLIQTLTLIIIKKTHNILILINKRLDYINILFLFKLKLKLIQINPKL